MRNLMFASALLLASATALAGPGGEYWKVPAKERGGKIQKDLKNGEHTEYKTDTHRVVPRSESRRVQRILDKLRADLKACQENNNVCEDTASLKQELDQLRAENARLRQQPAPVVQERPAQTYKNRIAVYGGVGPDSLKSQEEMEGDQTIELDSGPLAGVSYSRLFGDRWSVNAVGASTTRSEKASLTGLLGIGYDF